MPATLQQPSATTTADRMQALRTEVQAHVPADYEIFRVQIFDTLMGTDRFDKKFERKEGSTEQRYVIDCVGLMYKLNYELRDSKGEICAVEAYLNRLTGQLGRFSARGYSVVGSGVVDEIIHNLSTYHEHGQLKTVGPFDWNDK